MKFSPTKYDWFEWRIKEPQPPLARENVVGKHQWVFVKIKAEYGLLYTVHFQLVGTWERVYVQLIDDKFVNDRNA